MQRNDALKNAKNGAVEAPRPYPAGNAIGKPHSGIAPCAGRGLCIFTRPALRPSDIQAGVNGGFPQRESTSKDAVDRSPIQHPRKAGNAPETGHPDRFWGRGLFRRPSWSVVVPSPQHGGKTAPLYGNNAAFFPNFPLAGSMAGTLLVIALELFRRLCHRKRLMLFP